MIMTIDKNIAIKWKGKNNEDKIICKIINTLGKIANAITDTPVTMAVKSHLRIQRPVLLAIATNDGLGASAMNIGKLLNTKNVYFVPMSQDDCVKKPNSLVSDFTLIPECITLAYENKQYQPVFI